MTPDFEASSVPYDGPDEEEDEVPLAKNGEEHMSGRDNGPSWDIPSEKAYEERSDEEDSSDEKDDESSLDNLSPSNTPRGKANVDDSGDDYSYGE